MHAMLVIAHRGASVAAPENTPDAFRRADELGADGVELDVRLGLDGGLLVVHDPLPPPDEAGRRLIAELPTLDDALDACGSEMLVNVEVKNGVDAGGFDPTLAVVEPLVDRLRSHPSPAHRWLVSSFSWATIQACRAAAPEIATAWLCYIVDDRVARRVAEAGHAAVHPAEVVVTPELVSICHARGLAVNAWTCNDVDRLVELAEMGVDGVCTDVPDLALSSLGRQPGVGALRSSWMPRASPRGTPA
jgi:glycerophosphoryl diester phosphodiesterase